MTDQELHQLATDYAEQNPPADIKDEVLKRNLIGLNAEIFKKFLVWLTKTHCIVSREKVMEEYDVAVLLQHSNQISDQDTGTVRQTLLEYIFGKCTFEERSEE